VKAFDKARTAFRLWVPEPVKAKLRAILGKYRQQKARQAMAAPIVPAQSRRRYAARGKDVVFVSRVPRVREAKLAHALKSAGWRVVLLHGETPNYDLAPYFDEAVPFADANAAVDLALGYTPVAYHVFSPSGDVTSARFINARVGPTVFDTTDLLEAGYLGNETKIERVNDAILMQAHGIRHADGYCARDLQFKYAQRHFGYRLGGRAIFFPEYCWGTAVDAAYREQGPLRCVQAGNFGIEKEGEGDWGYMHIAEAFVAAGISFDLYPNWTHFGRGEREFKKIFSDYLELEKKAPLYKFHHPVSPDVLIERLRECDFGVSIIWAEVSGQPLHSFNPDLLVYCTSARIFDYLDAGLPVLLDARYRVMHALMRPYGAAIAVDKAFMSDIGKRLAALAAQDMRQRAIRASRGLAVTRHVQRLGNFYRRIAADVGISVG
jgi:hypothetical protein